MSLNLRTGAQSVESWIVAFFGLLGPFIPGLPDHPATAAPILIWAFTRIAQKILGPAAPDRRSFQTYEFWIGIFGTIAATIESQALPEGVYITVGLSGLLIVGMIAVRLFANKNFVA